MIARVHVDREAELWLFERMVRAEEKARVLLIGAPSGMGKSTLIQALRDACGETASALVDLKGGMHTVDDTLSVVAPQLDLPELADHPDGPDGPGVSSAELNRIVAIRSEINVTIHQGGERRDPAARLVRTLEDAGLRPVVLLFDTFDEALPEVRHLVRMLIWEAGLHSWLTVVVAGRELPEVRGCAWCARSTLELLKPADVLEYARRIGIALSAETARAINVVTHGIPARIVLAMDDLHRDQGPAG